MYCYNGSVLICQGISVYSTFFKLQVYPENSFQKIRLFFFLIHRKFQLLHTFFRQPCLIRPAITAGSLPELLRIGKLKPQILPFSRLQPALSFIRPDDPNPQFLFPTKSGTGQIPMRNLRRPKEIRRCTRAARCQIPDSSATAG